MSVSIFGKYMTSRTTSKPRRLFFQPLLFEDSDLLIREKCVYVKMADHYPTKQFVYFRVGLLHPLQTPLPAHLFAAQGAFPRPRLAQRVKGQENEK